jgi:hypothetical protein
MHIQGEDVELAQLVVFRLMDAALKCIFFLIRVPWMDFILKEEASQVEIQCLAATIWCKHPDRRTNAVIVSRQTLPVAPTNRRTTHVQCRENAKIRLTFEQTIPEDARVLALTNTPCTLMGPCVNFYLWEANSRNISLRFTDYLVRIPIQIGVSALAEAEFIQATSHDLQLTSLYQLPLTEMQRPASVA